MKKLILLSLLISSMTFAQSNFRTKTLNSTAQAVNLGPTYPKFVNMMYDSAGTIYIKFYDKFTTPSASTDLPVLTIPIYSKTVIINMGTLPVKFTRGLWIRQTNSSNDTSTTTNSKKPVIEISY